MKKWFTLFTLSLGTTFVLMLPYLRQIYYEPMREALHLNNADFGLTMSAYGITAVICYFPGGWVADRFNPKYLLSVSFLLTGLSGLYFATFPGFTGTMLVHIFWGISSILTFWSALLKVVRSLGASEEQGRLYGFLESFRGISSTIIGALALWMFGLAVHEAAGLTAVILFYSIGCLAMAPVSWLLLRKTPFKRSNESVIKDVQKILTRPKVWLIALMIFCAYTAYAGITYFTPYMQSIYGMSAALAGILAIVRTYVLQMAGGPIGGFISDKAGSVTRVMKWGFLLLSALLVILLVLPDSPAYLIAVLITMLLLVTIIFAIRGIYFAAVDEADVPMHLTGAVTGFASCIGYIPDVFVPMLFGNFLDGHPGRTGYLYIFAFLGGIAFIGFILSLVFIKMNRKTAAEQTPAVKEAVQ